MSAHHQVSFPCCSVPVSCQSHSKVHFNKKYQTQKRVKSPSICLLLTLPTELLQHIARYLGCLSRSSFAFSHPAILRAIGPDIWQELRKPRNLRKKGRFLKYLESDYAGEFMFCDGCKRLHAVELLGPRCPKELKPRRVNNKAVTINSRTKQNHNNLDDNSPKEAGSQNSKSYLVFGNGVYRVYFRHVQMMMDRQNLGSKHGICPYMLRCAGSRTYQLKGVSQTAESDLCFQRIPEMLTPHEPGAYEFDELREDLEDPLAGRWRHVRFENPSGGSLGTKFRRAGSRLLKTIVTIQGEDWWFYFPMTLAFFLPRSKPLRVQRRLSKSKDARKVDKVSEDGPEHHNPAAITSESRRDSLLTLSRGSAVDPVDASHPDYQPRTWWDDYYEDLDQPSIDHPVLRESNARRESDWVYYLYETKSGKPPWYDRSWVLKGCSVWMRVVEWPLIDLFGNIGKTLKRRSFDSCSEASSESDHDDYSTDTWEGFDDGSGESSEERSGECSTDEDENDYIVGSFRQAISKANNQWDVLKSRLKRRVKGLKPERRLLDPTPKPKPVEANLKVKVSHLIEPRPTKDGIFLKAIYLFNVKEFSKITAIMQELDFPICPHISTAGMAQNGRKIDLIRRYWFNGPFDMRSNPSYTLKCQSCGTIIEVFAWNKISLGAPIKVSVSIRAESYLGRGASEDDPRWQAFLGNGSFKDQGEAKTIEDSMPKGSMRPIVRTQYQVNSRAWMRIF